MIHAVASSVEQDGAGEGGVRHRGESKDGGVDITLARRTPGGRASILDPLARSTRTLRLLVADCMSLRMSLQAHARAHSQLAPRSWPNSRAPARMDGAREPEAATGKAPPRQQLPCTKHLTVRLNQLARLIQKKMGVPRKKVYFKFVWDEARQEEVVLCVG